MLIGSVKNDRQGTINITACGYMKSRLLCVVSLCIEFTIGIEIFTAELDIMNIKDMILYTSM